MAKSERRPQRQKAIPQRVQRVQGIRQSGAAGIHSGQGEYRRMSPGQMLSLIEDEFDGYDEYDY